MGRIVSMNDKNLDMLDTIEEKEKYCQEHFGMSYEETEYLINNPKREYDPISKKFIDIK